MVMPILIVWGFAYHYLTFRIIPIEEVLYLVFGYLVLATITILFIHLYNAGKITQKLQYVRLFAPLLLQFSLGSIIGGVSIFYWFSGSIYVSWPFILIILLLIISIEVFKHYLEKPVVQFSLYNFATILLFAIALPYFFKSLNPWLFVAAGAISLFLILMLVALLGRYSHEVKNLRTATLGVNGLIILIVGILYFYNFIPPVPLSIRDAGVYHSLKRSGSSYMLEMEHESFWQKLSPNPTIHMAPGERIYAFTAIYTPTDLNTDIFHDWQHYDENKKSWVSVSKLSFPINGKRKDGYRGYSYKNNLIAGNWRVFVETPRGQVLGQFQFKIEKVNTTPMLQGVMK